MILIIKHIEIEGPGTLGDSFKETNWQTKIVELEKGDTLPPLDECEAIISLGGPMNVDETDKYPFLATEKKFLKEALDTEIPVLGICLGAQLLAKAAGAEVRKAEQKEMGWYRVSLTEEGKKDELFKGLDNSLNVLQWHEDTFDIPPDSVLLATSSSCKNQAMRMGRCAWGLQFHPELTSEMLETWIDYYSVDLDKDKLLAEYYNKKIRYNWLAKVIYLNFSRRVTEVTKTKTKVLK